VVVDTGVFFDAGVVDEQADRQTVATTEIATKTSFDRVAVRVLAM
jgi:hypothetical protein